MKYKGINYDTGTITTIGGLTRETFDLERVEKEISIIKNELHCNAIRISGVNIDRIAKAAEIALKHDLYVWFSPSLPYDNQQNTLSFILQGAEAAEKLRNKYSNVIFIVGCELSIFTKGFIKGETLEEILGNMFSPLSLLKNVLGIKRTYNKLLNKFLSDALKQVKGVFKGQITYASGTWEKVDWHLFDIIGIDHYRSSFNKANYVKELQKYISMGKPLSVMEFGCCTYKGAENKGAMGWAIVDWKKERPELKGDYTRDEETQAKYIVELLNIFNNEQVFAAFAFTFILENYVYDTNPKYDFDIAAYGVVKSLGNNQSGYMGLSWQPKQAFFKLAEYYNRY